MTAIEIAAEAGGGTAAPPTEGHARHHGRRKDGSRGIPATRDLEVTLWVMQALAGAAFAVGLVAHTAISTVALMAGVCAAGVAATIVRAITTLTPVALRPGVIRRRRPVRVAVVGTAAAAHELRAELLHAGAGGVEVLGAIAQAATPGTDRGRAALGRLADLRRIVEAHRIDILLVGAGVSRARVVDAVMRSCEGDPVRVCDLSEFYEEVFGHVPIAEGDRAWSQHVLHPRFRERRSQRVIDVAVAGALLAVCLPFLGVVALLIRRDGGPALFRQSRIGRDGRPFVMYKLRTMRWEGDGEAASWTQDEDPRITPVGRILRRLHLDELPQLLNVLRGDMTLVGPRPEQPDIVAHLEELLPLWRGRHRYKPGLTGWAQIRCGYAGSHDGSASKLAHDLYYLRHHSLALDVAILVRTACQLAFSPRHSVIGPTSFVVRPGQLPPGERSDRRPSTRRFESGRVGRATTALVTGGAGFIGSHLVDALVDAGHDVVAVDDLSSGRWENLEHALERGARLENADVTDADEMLRLFAVVRPQVVFHLAAQIDVARAVADPLTDAEANVVGTLAVLEAARASGARRFVLSSTGGAIYGDASVIPTPEHAALAPISPYGAAKAAAEQYTALYGRLYGLSTMTLRLANIYGPRQGLSGEGGVIARYCRARVHGVPAQVFGDGLQTRDYVYVRDVVAAFMAAGRSDASGHVNIGTGTETTLLDLLELLGLPAEFGDARSGDVRRSSLDASAAERQLGWRAGTPLVDGLAETLAFARQAWAPDRIAA